MLRAAVIFLTLFLLWLLVAETNHYLTPLHIYLFVGGLFVTFAALRLPLRAGLAAVLLGGLLCDANTPIAAGLPAVAFSLAHAHTLFFAAAFLVIYQLRDRMARDEPFIRLFVALLANLSLFVALSCARQIMTPLPAAAWGRLLADLVCSQVVVALIAPWFFALQGSALTLTRAEPVALN
jgi:hypothetical protein